MLIAKIRMKNKFNEKNHWDELRELFSLGLDELITASEQFSKAVVESHNDLSATVVEVRIYAIRFDTPGDSVGVVNISPERVFMYNRDGIDPYAWGEHMIGGAL